MPESQARLYQKIATRMNTNSSSSHSQERTNLCCFIGPNLFSKSAIRRKLHRNLNECIRGETCSLLYESTPVILKFQDPQRLTRNHFVERDASCFDIETLFRPQSMNLSCTKIRNYTLVTNCLDESLVQRLKSLFKNIDDVTALGGT